MGERPREPNVRCKQTKSGPVHSKMSDHLSYNTLGIIDNALAVTGPLTGSTD